MKGYLQKVVEFAKFRFAAISINSYDKAKRMLVKKIVVVHLYIAKNMTFSIP